MKNNAKGFTLIELLAVIVILAIIALITVPGVLNIISDAREGAAVDSAYGMREAARNYYLLAIMNDIDTFDGYTCSWNAAEGEESCTTSIELDGTIPSEGTITIANNGELSFAGIKINGFDIAYDTATGKFSIATGA